MDQPQTVVYDSNSVYQIYNSNQPQVVAKVNGISASVAKFFANLALILAIFGIVLSFIFYGSSLVDWIENSINHLTDSSFGLSNKEVSTLTVNTTQAQVDYQPIFNPTLPKTSQLIIPSIGVNTTLQEATYDNYEEALKKGVWRVSDFGAPGESGVPTILAAHRFGYLAWSNLYRHENSFYNLPKTKVGDTVEIIWHQRKYVYEIYAQTKGTEITDYSANLILYTCESLVGRQRVFDYARLIKV